jgi:hypothetical protein
MVELMGFEYTTSKSQVRCSNSNLNADRKYILLILYLIE